MPTIRSAAYDFEDGTLMGWQILTECQTVGQPSYGGTPQLRGTQYISDNSGFSGDYMIRSQNPGSGNDWTTGILESPHFQFCSTTTIRYLLGGGSHCGTGADPNCISDCSSCPSNLVSFQLEVLDSGTWQMKSKDCGEGSTTLTERTWIVSDEAGKTGRIRAYDLNAGGWGYNLLDNIRIECTDVAAFSSLTASSARGNDMPIDRAIDGDLSEFTSMTLSGTAGTQSINLTLALGDQLLAGVRIYLAKLDCDQSYSPFPIHTRFEVDGTPIVGISNDAELTITEPLNAAAWHVDLPCPSTFGALADGSRIDFFWPAVSASSLVIKYEGGATYTHFPVFELQPLTS